MHSAAFSFYKWKFNFNSRTNKIATRNRMASTCSLIPYERGLLEKEH